MRILLIAGGWSNERKISLIGADAIHNSLLDLGHQVEFLDLSEGFDALLERAAACEFAFINLHGSPGEDGLVQAMLDNIGLPYQGSGPAASFLALNKPAAKQIYRRNGLRTPPWITVITENQHTPLPLNFPIFVKPESSGSSIGISKVEKEEDLEKAIKLAFSHSNVVLVEEAVSGLELSCAVIGEETLPPILIKPNENSFFNYQCKYTPGASEEICPAPLQPDLELAVRRAALEAHRILGLKGYSRSDFICDHNNVLHILETNTLPGMTPISLLPRAAAVAGYSYSQLLAKLLEL